MLADFDIWKLLAGLGIFLFGLFLMEESIRRLAGKAFKRFIRQYTSNSFKSIFSGILVTAILQSSSAVSLMILAFVGAGIMKMRNAVGIILGSNLGTTVTAWVVVIFGFKLNIESFALPLIAVGGLGTIFLGQSEKYSNLSKLLVGFGFLFMGLDYMKTSVESFSETIDLGSIPDYGLFIYVALGFLITAIMQSSSATIALILTALNAYIIGFDDGVAMVIGANMGTTVTVLLGSLGGSQIKKRVAYSHFIFNVVVGVVALIFVKYLVIIVTLFFDTQVNAVMGLALFHTIFNALGVVIFAPFIKPYTHLLTKYFPDKKAQLTIYISNTSPEVVEASISAMKKETTHLIRNVLSYNLSLLNIEEKLVFSRFDESDRSLHQKRLTPEVRYENLKLLQAEIFRYSSKINSYEVSEKESMELNQYLHSARMALHSAKTLKDIKHDFDEFESADDMFLNDQYTNFRKRLIETYLKIDKVLKENGKSATKDILKILKNLKKNDKYFVELVNKAVSEVNIENLHLSTVLIVNRAFVQSSRQILLAIREVVLDEQEIKAFEEVEEINSELVETI
ncbi:MAG: Na/Pi cotransporter family protein [Chitinophagales bacterium]|nr:Na/Pi cotransporter family protein [Chitinophagales bacterium]